jgi:hypothetical protein
MARLTGKAGAVYWNSTGSTYVKIADIFDWEFHANTTLLDVSIKGDAIERWIPSHASGVRFTAKRYNQGLEVFPVFTADSATNATQTTWRLDLIDADTNFTQITARGFAIASSTSAPRGMSEETFELQIDDMYAYSK